MIESLSRLDFRLRIGDQNSMNVAGVIRAIPSMDPQKRRAVRERATSWLEEGSPERSAAARAVLDALVAAEAQERGILAQRVATLDSVQRIVEAFKQKPLSTSDRRIVQVLLDHPGLSSEALTQKAGWKAQAWHMRFGLMCRDRGPLLWPAPFDEGRAADFYCGILADFDEQTRGFTLKPEAVQAFTQLGLRARRTA